MHRPAAPSSSSGPGAGASPSQSPAGWPGAGGDHSRALPAGCPPHHGAPKATLRPTCSLTADNLLSSSRFSLSTFCLSSYSSSSCTSICFSCRTAQAAGQGNGKGLGPLPLVCPHTLGTRGDPIITVFAQPQAQSPACAGPGSRGTGWTRQASGAGLWLDAWELGTA